MNLLLMINILGNDAFASTLLTLSNLTSIETRATVQIDKYLKKAIRYNNLLVVWMIKDYLVLREVNEGAISNRSSRITLLGKILNIPNSSAKQYMSALQLVQLS